MEVAAERQMHDLKRVLEEQSEKNKRFELEMHNPSREDSAYKKIRTYSTYDCWRSLHSRDIRSYFQTRC